MAPQARPVTAELPLPHEREGDTGYADHAPRHKLRQAHQDLATGQVDTDLHNRGGMDEGQRRELLRREAARATRPAGGTLKRGT